MFTLRLPPDLEARLDAMARKTGRSKSSLAREAVVEHIGGLEDIAAAESAMEADDGTRYSLVKVPRKK
jgi:RHH-type rel operon transcriptional repressor/antitoxin RelB